MTFSGVIRGLIPVSKSTEKSNLRGCILLQGFYVGRMRGALVYNNSLSPELIISTAWEDAVVEINQIPIPQPSQTNRHMNPEAHELMMMITCYAMPFMTISIQYTEIIWRASHMMPATHQADMMSGWLTDQAGEFEDGRLSKYPTDRFM